MKNSLLIYHDLIAAIVEAMEARDPYTASHSMRVSDTTEMICHLLKVPEGAMEIIHIAAHLHDIGKIGIPDSVLVKSSSLTEDEWNVMRQHPETGYQILSKISGFRQIAEIVKHHHERWNGAGYPDALAKQKIPFGARIIAVADSMDAMLNDRMYRRAMSLEDCRLEIENNCAIMYDPYIVKAVLQNWSHFGKYYSDQSDRGQGGF